MVFTEVAYGEGVGGAMRKKPAGNTLDTPCAAWCRLFLKCFFGNGGRAGRIATLQKSMFSGIGDARLGSGPFGSPAPLENVAGMK